MHLMGLNARCPYATILAAITSRRKEGYDPRFRDFEFHAPYSGKSARYATIHMYSQRSVLLPIRFAFALTKLRAIGSVASLSASEIGRCVEDTARVMVSLTARLLALQL